MLAAYPDYKLNVYQSRRTCAMPQAVYDATKKNATEASLGGGGDSLVGALMGSPYPLPFNAYEIVWNHNLRYRGYKLARTFASAAPTRTGRSAERRVGKEGVRTCRSRWAADS